jgi:ubiquinone/menaquinone biosynthesis C-methylase UbiE
MNSDTHAISRVARTKAEAKASYDRFSRFYDYFAGVFEQKYSRQALRCLDIAPGETILEIGFGTGHCLREMAQMAGGGGSVYGLDISTGMAAVSRRRLGRAGVGSSVTLTCGDAANMPYGSGRFDAVFASFVLELFDSPEIPVVLAEMQRVLRPTGRIGLISMSKEGGSSALLRLYEWLHERLPRYVDCRPIYAEHSIRDAGFEIRCKERVSLLGLPADILIAGKRAFLG